MLRRKKKQRESAASDGADPAAVADAPPPEASTQQPDSGVTATMKADGADAEPGSAAIEFADREPEPEPAPEPEMYPTYPAPPPEASQPFVPPSAAPVPPPEDEHLSPAFWMQSLTSVITKSGEPNRDELARQAEQEFNNAIMPGLMGLRDAVPDASSPEEAKRILAEREAQYEYPEDPEAGTLSQSDIYRADSSVYYRIRKRFEKPRRRVGWGDPWRPPPGLAEPDPPRRALNRPD